MVWVMGMFGDGVWVMMLLDSESSTMLWRSFASWRVFSYTRDALGFSRILVIVLYE